MNNIHLYAGLIIIVGVVLALGVLARNLQPRGFAEKWDKGEVAAFFPGMHLGATVIAGLPSLTRAPGLR
jgi:cytochrome c oxidase assembly factor CtaG